MSDEKLLCWNCDATAVTEYQTVPLCRLCSEAVEDTTGYCSVECQITHQCDQSC